jgi:hypothetical protein
MGSFSDPAQAEIPLTKYQHNHEEHLQRKPTPPRYTHAKLARLRAAPINTVLYETRSTSVYF